jgi:hypothetical protein
MLDLIIAAALAQAAAPAAGPPDPCNAAGRAEQALAGCPTWRLVARGAQGRGFVDPESARRDGDRVEVMTRTLLNSPLGGDVHSFNVRLELHCASRRTRSLEFAGFDAAGARNYARGADEQPRAATPGSPFSQMLDEFCPRQTGRP